MPTLCELFAGGGMARPGLGDRWTCRFANDFDYGKSVSYRRDWGDAEGGQDGAASTAGRVAQMRFCSDMVVAGRFRGRVQ